MFAYIGFESFYDVLRDILRSKFSKLDHKINTLASLYYIVPIIFAPIFGHLTDKFGRKITLMA